MKVSKFKTKSTLGNFKMKKLINSIAPFKKDQGGVAAVEFAIVAPVLVAFLLSSIAVFDGFRGLSRYGNTATTLVDIVTRTSYMDDDKFDEAIAITESLLGDYGEVSDLVVSITSVTNEFDSSSDPDLSVAWSESNNNSSKLRTSDLINYVIPSIPEGQSVVLVEISGTYTPLIATADLALVPYKRYVVRRPRFVDTIPYN